MHTCMSFNFHEHPTPSIVFSHVMPQAATSRIAALAIGRGGHASLLRRVESSIASLRTSSACTGQQEVVDLVVKQLQNVKAQLA